MITGRIGRLLLVGLIILLGIQLTGLSCLDDWQITPLTKALLIASLFPDRTGEADQPEEDGCPCHLALPPVTSGIFQICCPVQFHRSFTPSTPTLSLASLLFRPPLLS